MKRINRCDEIALSAARCCAKAIIDVAAVKFRFGAVKFVEKLLFDEADKKISITRSHFSTHSDSIDLFVVVTLERFGARSFVGALVKKVFERQESFMVGDNCAQRSYIHSENDHIFAWKIEIAKSFERMISVFDI